MVNAPVCPSCGGYIPNNETPGKYPGAVSHVDNTTEICSQCGQKEALRIFAGEPISKDDWVAPTR